MNNFDSFQWTFRNAFFNLTFFVIQRWCYIEILTSKHNSCNQKNDKWQISTVCNFTKKGLFSFLKICHDFQKSNSITSVKCCREKEKLSNIEQGLLWSEALLIAGADKNVWDFLIFEFFTEFTANHSREAHCRKVTARSINSGKCTLFLGSLSEKHSKL